MKFDHPELADETFTDIEAVNNNVTYRVLPLPEESENGLVTPWNQLKTQRWATVESIGPGIPNIRGEMVPVSIPREIDGERTLIYLMAHAIEKFRVGEQEFGVSSELDVLGWMAGKDIRTFQPKGAFCQIEKIEVNQLANGLLLPPGTVPLPNVGIVRKLGTGLVDYLGNPVPFGFEENDVVTFIPTRTMVVDFRTIGLDEKIILIGSGDITGRFRKAS